MKRGKRRKQASSGIKYVEFERINYVSSGVYKYGLRFKCVQILLLTTFYSSSAVDVDWEAKRPAFFGNIAYLQCNISDTAFNCSQRPRQWIGGPMYRPLCYNNNCTSTKKYEVMKQSSCLYTLMIRNFSDLDVNCEYTCSYGVSRKRRNLTLDEQRFIYKPHAEDIKEEVIEKDKKLNWKINITKIFPKPSCWADLNGQNITNDMKISVTKPGFYFATNLQINHDLPSCGRIGISCYLGEYKINITSKNFDECQVSKNSNIVIVLLVMLGVVMLLGIAVILLCVRHRNKNNKYKRARNGHSNSPQKGE